jgi:Cft2 family RNA processing exonuclease
MNSSAKGEQAVTIELEVLAGGVSHPDNAYLVRAAGTRVLLDAGAAQSSDWVHAIVEPPHAVWLSHVHADHAQGWSALVRAFGVIPTWTSPQTRHWLGPAWTMHAPHAASSVSDVIEILASTQPLTLPTYNPDGPTIVLSQHPCGHIPGSSALYMDIAMEERFHRLCYLSDFSLHDQLSVPAAQLQSWPTPDTLIIECALAHVPRATRDAVHDASRALASSVAQEGASIWPVSSFGHAQEVMACALTHGVRPAVWSTLDTMGWGDDVDTLNTIEVARAALTSGRMVIVPGAHMSGGVSQVLGLEFMGHPRIRFVSTSAHPQGSLAAALWSGQRAPRWGGRRLEVEAQMVHIDLFNHAPLEDIVSAVLTLEPAHTILVHGQRKGIAATRRALRRAGYSGRISAPKHGGVVPLA